MKNFKLLIFSLSLVSFQLCYTSQEYQENTTGWSFRRLLSLQLYYTAQEQPKISIHGNFKNSGSISINHIYKNRIVLHCFTVFGTHAIVTKDHDQAIIGKSTKEILTPAELVRSMNNVLPKDHFYKNLRPSDITDFKNNIDRERSNFQKQVLQNKKRAQIQVNAKFKPTLKSIAENISDAQDY